MDLSTSYMGLKLRNPLIVGSSNMTAKVENIKKCEEAGAGAVVLKSLFEEQILADSNILINQDDMYFWYPEAINYVKETSRMGGIEDYLKLIEQSKAATSIPIIASINCTSPYEWVKFAEKIEESGADGIELNIFLPPADINTSSQVIEDNYINIVKAVDKIVTIPVSVKLGHYFTNLMRITHRLCNNKVKGLVLFNRYYRPDIDINKLTITKQSIFSSPDEITLALRWIALLSEKISCELAGNTGVYDYEGMVKHILCGASAVQVCSVLYKKGFEHITTMLAGLSQWMEKNGHKRITDFKGLIHDIHETKGNFDRVQFMQKTTGSILEKA